MISPLVLLVATAATARLAILLSQDKITEGWRARVRLKGWEPDTSADNSLVYWSPLPGERAARWRWVYRLVRCVACNSIWFAAVVAVPAVLWSSNRVVFALLLIPAMSLGSIYLNARKLPPWAEEDDDDDAR